MLRALSPSLSPGGLSRTWDQMAGPCPWRPEADALTPVTGLTPSGQGRVARMGWGLMAAAGV